MSITQEETENLRQREIACELRDGKDEGFCGQSLVDHSSLSHVQDTECPP